MKQKTRTVAAVVTTGLLAGGGLAATVNGLSEQGTQVSSSPGRTEADQAALSAALAELESRNTEVRQQLAHARQQLHTVDTRLGHERKVAARLVGGSSAAATKAGAAGTVASSAPSTHAVTRASGSTTSSGTAPSVHTTTRASGSQHAGPSGSGPKVHTTTRASGGASGAAGHGGERGDD